MDNHEETIQKLQRELDKRELTDELKKTFSLKWVEKVVLWFIVFLATGVMGVIAAKYIFSIFK